MLYTHTNTHVFCVFDAAYFVNEEVDFGSQMLIFDITPEMSVQVSFVAGYLSMACTFIWECLQILKFNWLETFSTRFST